MSDDSRLGQLNPYGLRAMAYVRDNCPSRYAAIDDPVSYFSSLGDQLLDEVLALEPTLAETAAVDEEWIEGVGRRNMARLMAEGQVFSELFRTMPPEDLDEAQAPDLLMASVFQELSKPLPIELEQEGP